MTQSGQRRTYNAQTPERERASADGGEQHEDEGFKRRMPDKLRRHLIKMQGGKSYLPAAYRIVWFRDELGDEWGIKTALVEGGHEAGYATVRAEILHADGRVIASGHKTEAKGDFPAGWVEKAETGAIARALSFLGFGSQFMPELDEDGYRPADSPAQRHVYANQRADEETERTRPASDIWEGPGLCPRCHAPEGKRHGRQCLS